MKGEALTSEPLTDDARREFIASKLQDRFTNAGKLLVPTYAMYESLADDEGLLRLAKDMLRWIGMKPHSLHVAFGRPSQAGALYELTKSTIIVHEAYREHPFAVGGVIALAVTDMAFQRYEVADSGLVEFGTVEFGLSLWILNAFKPRMSPGQSLYHIIDSSWQLRDGLKLRHYTPKEYARQFETYTQENRIPKESFSKGLNRRTKHLLPASFNNTHRLSTPTVILKHQKRARILWCKVLLIAAIIATTTVTILILGTQKNPTISEAQIQDERSLNILKDSLASCYKDIEQVQMHYNPDDIFSANKVEEVKARCASLNSQYGYALQAYRDKYVIKP